MAKMCATCAYRPGTEPNLDGFTRAKAWTCEELGTPFLCHGNRDLSGELLPGEPEAMCAGFLPILKERIASGFYKKQPAERRELISIISLGLDEIADRLDAHKAGK